MCFTEPGYYADGRFGIRIENVVLVREAKTPNNFGGKGFLGFEHVTMVRPTYPHTVLPAHSAFEDRLISAADRVEQCPIHKKLVDAELLTVQEREWLDAYHKEVWEKVSPLLKGDSKTLEWLGRECSPL